MNKVRRIFVLLALVLVWGTGCGTAAPLPTPVPTPLPAATAATAAAGTLSDGGEPGYPVPSVGAYPVPGEGAALPAQEGYIETAPSVPMPEPDAGSGSVGGYLVRSMGEGGFLPVNAQTLYLAEVLLDNQGQKSVISVGDDSPVAELLPAGVFVFGNVPPGNYGIVVDIGYTEFPVTGEDGQPLLIDVQPNGVLDLGALLIEMP